MNERKECETQVTKLALTRAEAARMLSMSVASLDRDTKAGRLHPVRIRRRPLYPIWELERYLRDNMAALDDSRTGTK